MHSLFRAVFWNNQVHKGLEILSLFGSRNLSLNPSSSNIKRGKQIGCFMTFISVFKARTVFPLSVRICPVFLSNACMLSFSSTQTTTALRGGFKYNPAMSATLLANWLSVLIHHECWRCKLNLSSRNIFHKASVPTGLGFLSLSQCAAPQAKGYSGTESRADFRSWNWPSEKSCLT